MIVMTPVSRSIPPLDGLVIARGRGAPVSAATRARSTITVSPSVRWALELVAGTCPRGFVSVRAAPARERVYRDLPHAAAGRRDGVSRLAPA